MKQADTYERGFSKDVTYYTVVHSSLQPLKVTRLVVEPFQSIKAALDKAGLTDVRFVFEGHPAIIAEN